VTPVVAMVTRWGVRCGMDNYVRELVDAVSDRLDVRIYAAHEPGIAEDADTSVVRDWDADAPHVDQLIADLRALRPDLIHVQFNWGYITVNALGRLLEFARADGIPLVVQLHATFDNPREGSLRAIAAQLGTASRVIVHGEADVERLRQWGVADNVWKWRLGEWRWPRRDRNELRECLGIADRSPVIGTFGFLQPRKSVLQIIQAVGLLRERHPDVLLVACNSLHPRGFDPAYVLACRNEIARLGLHPNVELITRYLAEDVVMTLLQAADVLVLPHVDTPEGTSAAAKFCIAAGRPLIVSSEHLFDDYRDSALTLERVDVGSIAGAVERVVGDVQLARSLADGAAAHADRLDWGVVGAEYEATVRELAGA